MTNDDQLIKDFARRGSTLFLKWVFAPALICAYLIAMVVGLASDDATQMVVVIMPIIIGVYGFVYPYVAIRTLSSRALRHRPGDAPGERLARILRLPWRASLFTTYVAWTLGGFSFALPVCLAYGKEPIRIFLGTAVAFCFGVVVSFPFGISLEKLCLPHAMEERKAHPTIELKGSGIFWPRQSWFLPYTFVASIIATLVLSSCVVVVKLIGVRGGLDQVQGMIKAGDPKSAEEVAKLSASLFVDLAYALPWVAVLVIVLPTITTYLLARRQALGATAVGSAITGLASGRISSPEWVSTDEIGDLASALNAVLSKLRQIPETLASSASRLVTAGNDLGEANNEQQQSLNQQAAAIQQTQVTSQEIKQTSQMTAERAEAMLRVARRAEDLGHEGEAAIEQSMQGLSTIQQFVDAMQVKLNRLAESATQIGEITEAVKDMADQSNLLAVNAAIEAARAGENGKGFAVLAREIRALADQSVKSTTRIRGILGEVIGAIRAAATMVEQGSRDIAGGLERMRASSDSLRELSRLSQENSAAMRQIVAAVNQQNAGISQIFSAIADLSQIMDATLRRLESTQQATETLQAVSTEVGQMASQFTVN
ncbi:methyl-accepting chemotaxis protein [Hyalangium rubrum]|uniref:Methyl-accepting chemotaxis protein n=1 Tax=Hyalangium rubrum TaxID=3103134 RepID=A0ABU5H0K7_9BACT|nr:methyl-accepting chemotaxis protein [Hyalangium sp. s54d21]MDY7226659.1 methyl-accepting chemotaxis protein [Hyalangium sp. s54d21]